MVKRGRPISSDTTDVATLELRQAARLRVQQYRERAQAAQAQNRNATTAQLQQSNRIVDRSLTQADTPTTASQLGLRLQGLTIAQDPLNILPPESDLIDVIDSHNIYTEHQTRADTPQIPSAHVRTPEHTPIVEHHPSTQKSRKSIESFFYPTIPSRHAVLSTVAQPPAPVVAGDIGTVVDDDGFPQYNVDDYDSLEHESEEEEGGEGEEEVIIDTGSVRHTNSNVHATHVAQLATPAPHPPPLSPIPASSSSLNPGPILPSTTPSASPQILTQVPFTTPQSASQLTSQPRSLTQIVAAKLAEQLVTHGFHGCSEDKHADDLTHHYNKVGNHAHCDLDELLDDTGFPSALSNKQRLKRGHLEGIGHIEPSHWQSTFCGVSSNTEVPRYACLHKEEVKYVPPQTAFDIDSFLGFASSLAFARQGIWYQPVPLATQNVASNVHVKVNIDGDDNDEAGAPRFVPTAIKDIPHFFLGRVEGSHDIGIHVLFPHLPPSAGNIQFLKHDQLKVWVDDIFSPAIYKYAQSHVLQHLPASFRQAQAASHARQVETRMVAQHGYGTQQSIAYFLSPDILVPAWDDIISKTEEPAFARFREPQLYFSAKGTKLLFKSTPTRPTIVHVLDNFRAYLNIILDFAYIYEDRFYVDVGKEICASSSRLRHQQPDPDEQAQVYLWKECCLKSYVNWLYDGRPPKSGHKFYQIAFLRDACNLTCEPAKNSDLRKGGLIYSQMYGSFKESIDAAKTYPFQNEGLEELCLDPLIRKGANAIAGGRRRDVEVVDKAYLASKNRLHVSLDDSISKSFGIREEHRIAWLLLLALYDVLTALPSAEVEAVVEQIPTYVWPIQTERFFRFTSRNTDKFASAFELVSAQCHPEYYTWEESKIMAMFLRCLRFSVGAHQLARESSLWWGRKTHVTTNDDDQVRRTYYGLGFMETLPKYGYGWLQPRFDWDRPAFLSTVTDHVLFGNNVLKNQYLRRGGQVREFYDNTRRLEAALVWIREHERNEPVTDQLIQYIIHLILQQFRMDVLDTIPAREVVPEEFARTAGGEFPFTYELLTNILGDPIHLVSGNRSGDITPGTVINRLFGAKDKWPRPHWEHKPFRIMYQRARVILASKLTNHKVYSAFKRRFVRVLLAFHWILPYPAKDNFTNRNKLGERLWYSVHPRTPIPAALLTTLELEDWEWARQDWHTLKPPKLPKFLPWSTDEWLTYLEANQL